MGPLLFAAVSLLFFGQIFSAPTSGEDTPTMSLDTTQPNLAPQDHSTHHHLLELDTSNSILGDIPIVPDHSVEIINRRYVPLRNCKELRDEGFDTSGLYVVQPGNGGEFVVFCDMTLLGGGWTIIQRRLNGNTKFDRDYAAYKNGFGDFAENFWLGLDKINLLTQESNTQSTMEVYFGMKAFFGASSFSRYSSFSVGTEEDGYRLKISGFSGGTAGNSMTFHNNQKFSTFDKDQDIHKNQHCAQSHKGGWWFKNCLSANLNGKYYESESSHNVDDGINWTAWLGPSNSLKSTLIAIRPGE